MADFTITIGDVASFEVDIQDCGNPINSSDYLIFFTVKKPFYGAVNLTPESDDLAVIRKNNQANGGITNLEGGKVRITLLSADTHNLLDGVYDYDIQLARIIASNEVHTINSGTIEFSSQITSRISPYGK
jgi:hypothetical protein